MTSCAVRPRIPRRVGPPRARSCLVSVRHCPSAAQYWPQMEPAEFGHRRFAQRPDGVGRRGFNMQGARHHLRPCFERDLSKCLQGEDPALQITCNRDCPCERESRRCRQDRGQNRQAVDFKLAQSNANPRGTWRSVGVKGERRPLRRVHIAR